MFSSGSKVAGIIWQGGRGVAEKWNAFWNDRNWSITPDDFVCSPPSPSVSSTASFLCAEGVLLQDNSSSGPSLWNQISLKFSVAGGEGMDGVQVFTRLVFSQPLCLGQGFVDEVVGCQLGVWDSGEAKEGFNFTLLGPFGKVSDQGSGFGLVVSAPLHICQLWTEGAAEKTAVTERPAGKTSTTQGWRLHTDVAHFKQAQVIWNLFHHREEYNQGQSPVYHGTHTHARGQFRP